LCQLIIKSILEVINDYNEKDDKIFSLQKLKELNHDVLASISDQLNNLMKELIEIRNRGDYFLPLEFL
jgi:hypothetical protein